MPNKLDRCVKKLIEEGKSESSAYAICTKSIGNDAVFTGENKIDPNTGFMHTPVVICRSGTQGYLGRELGLTGNDANKMFNVLRHPEDVTHPESVATYENIIATDEHPNDRWIYIDNVKEHQKGQVSNVKVVGDTIEGLLTITDQDLINKIQSGKVEVSLGYAYKLIAEDGEYNGEPYQYRYKDMIANHLSIVEKGRCGKQCRITDDNYATITDEIPIQRVVDMKITINGIEFEVDDALGEAIMAERSAKESDMEETTKMAEDMEEELVEVKKANDRLKARVDAATDSKMTDAQINELVAERAGLVAFAQGICGDAMPDSTEPLAIKTAVVEKHFNISMDGKSEAYIAARFDMVQEDQVAHDSSVSKLTEDMKKKQKIATDNEQIAKNARSNYMKRKGL